MTSTITDRLNGLTTSVAIKVPCRAATTANITLFGLQTVDGVTLAARQRVLVKDQNNPVDNGIYLALSGDWLRSTDFDGSFDAVGGTLIHVNSGTVNANTYWTIDGNDALIVGSDDIVVIPSSGNLDFQAVIAASGGSALVGFVQAGTGAVARTGQAKLRDTVSVKDFGAVGDGVTDDTAAIQAAINSGAKRIIIGTNCAVTAVLNLVANQTIEFAGGKLITNALFNVTSGVLAASARANVVIKDAIIDASATPGVTGIRISNSPNARVEGARLTKCNVEFYGPNNTTPMNYVLNNSVIDGGGWSNTLVYISAVFKASYNDVIAYNGLEGFAIYGACSHVKYVNCEAYGHVRDGFVVIEGQKIAYVNCLGYNNTQSAFVTQRLAAGSDVQSISYSGCHAYSNTVDGFDIRGANTTPFGINMLVTIDGCISNSNGGAGFYIVMAEGTTLSGCVAAQNQFPGISIDQSDNVLLTGCRSASNANGVAPSTAKAGILFQSCSNSGAVGCISSNTIGVTQAYGISFTGTTTNNWITGGNFLNNSVRPAQLGNTGTSVFVSGAAIQDIANVFADSVTGNTGVHFESGFGVPSHTRPKASIYRRVDSGGSGEVYTSSGGGTWTLL